MIKFNSPRSYALTTGILLFCFGFFGFAFRSSFNIGNGYLIAGLVLGFWGIVAGSGKQ